MGKAYGELYEFLRSNKLVQKGDPFATYLKWDSVTMFSVMNICIPVEEAEKGKGRIRVATVPEQNVVKAIYFGSYSKMEPAYRALAQYMKEAGKIEAAGPSEIYITSPMSEKDTAKWETHIVFPFK
jgi:effector-binding domain-containing protein